jgi:hypothetical protein
MRSLNVLYSTKKPSLYMYYLENKKRREEGRSLPYVQILLNFNEDLYLGQVVPMGF